MCSLAGTDISSCSVGRKGSKIFELGSKMNGKEMPCKQGTEIKESERNTACDEN